MIDPSWALFIVLVCSFFYWYLTKNNDYFTKRGINGPKPYILIGNILDQLIYPSSVLDEKWRDAYGNLYGYFVCLKPVLRVGEPELIRQILIKDFDKFHDRFGIGNVEHEIFDQAMSFVQGDQWRRIRQLSSPAFTTSKIKLMSNKINSCATDLIDYLKQQADEHGEVDCNVTSTAFTLQVIASCAFATELNLISNQDHPFIKHSKQLLSWNPLKFLSIFTLPTSVNTWLGYRSIVNEQTLYYLCDLSRTIIGQRKTNKVESKRHNDFLQNLMDAEINDDDVEQDGFGVKLNRTSLKPDEFKMTEDQVIAQALQFLFAGYVTTASTLSYAMYELALKPEIQDRLYAEVSTVDRIDIESVAKLDYLDAVLSETLRLHPPATEIFRQCTEECKLVNTGITLTKGLHVEISIQAMHHSEQFFPEPKRFDPMRFMPENRHLIKPYTYLPFGDGPRYCIGMQFALIELKIALARIVKTFKVTKTSKTEIPPRIYRIPQLNTPKSVFLGLSIR